MTIEEQVKQIIAIGRENGDSRSLAVAIEAQQRWIEYLELLESLPLDTDASLTVRVDGKTIRFNSSEEMAKWIASVR